MTAPPLTPSERLALSRERLRVAMGHRAAPDARTGNAAHGTGLMEMLKTALPGASVVIDALGQWWARHPLHSTGILAGDTALAALRPLARRYPVALVGGAVVLGAVLAWSRPWRWLLRPPLLTALGPALLSSVLASGAVQSWLLAALAKDAAATAQPPPPGP